MSWALLGVGVAAALLTANALHPPRVWAILFPSFVAALFVAEAAGWALMTLAVAVAATVWQGALGGWAG